MPEDPSGLQPIQDLALGIEAARMRRGGDDLEAARLAAPPAGRTAGGRTRLALGSDNKEFTLTNRSAACKIAPEVTEPRRRRLLGGRRPLGERDRPCRRPEEHRDRPGGPRGALRGERRSGLDRQHQLEDGGAAG